MSHRERPESDPKEGGATGAAPPGAQAPESPPTDENPADVAPVSPEAAPVEEPGPEPDQQASGAADAEPEPAEGESEPAEGESEPAEDDAEEPVVEVEPTEEDLLRARIEALEAELADRTAKLRAVSKAYTDLQEDLDAFRTRTAQQLAITAERRAAEAVEKFFDPVQNLRRSLEAAGDEHGGLIDGLKMILQQFMDSLQKLGLEQVPGVGSDFDPNVHEALAITPVSDPGIDGKVLMVHNAGYRVRDILIQAAQVIVGKYEAPVVVAATDDGEDADDGEDGDGDGEAPIAEPEAAQAADVPEPPEETADEA